MPLPTPNGGETESEFMDRCMANPTMNDEFPDASQRAAVCRSQWSGKKERTMDKQWTIGHVSAVHEEKRVDSEGNEVPVGIVEGYLATWDVDRANDRFVRGAFTDSIAELRTRKRFLRLKRNHWNLIGGFDPEKMQEDEKGLYGVAEINLLVAEGREAYALAKQGVLSDFSVGFGAELEDVEIVEGVRVFKRARLWETSLVDEPMNARAEVTAVRGMIENLSGRESMIRAAAEYAKARDGYTEEQRAEIEAEFKQQYPAVVGHPSPFVRGSWSWTELRALPKSLRWYIIGNERLSHDALSSLAATVPPATEGEPPANGSDEIKALIVALRGEKAINEDTIAEVRGLLEAKREAIDTMRDVIGREDFNEDASAEFIGMLESDTERNGVILSILGTEDEEAAMDEDDNEKAINDIAAMLKEAW